MTLPEILDALGFKQELKRPEWERWRHKDAPDISEFALVLYETWSDVPRLRAAQEYLIKLGKYIKVQQINSY
jgi:hypothetical protein